jgi:hypothetical protein
MPVFQIRNFYHKSMNCRLCDSSRCTPLTVEDTRSYFRCGACGLIFVPLRDHVSVEEEKRRYGLHENRPGHEGYVRFLTELVAIVAQETPPPGTVLDFGSGKEAVLTRLLRERGYDCTAYDPLYNTGAGALAKTYDTVVLCEVAEHLRDLEKAVGEIKGAAGSAGKIIIRTRLYPSPEEFTRWWYKDDPTHVNFFCNRSIEKLAELLGRKKVRQEGADIFVTAR